MPACWVQTWVHQPLSHRKARAPRHCCARLPFDRQRIETGEQPAFPTEVAELALAHKVGSKVEQAYRRTDQFQKRSQLADAWVRFCSTPVSDGKVVPLRG